MSKGFSFGLSSAAEEYLRNEVRRSTLLSPVVYLLRARSLEQTATEANRSVPGTPNPERSKESAAGHVALGPPQLIPCIYSRWHFLGLFMVKISGIVFFFPPSLRRAVNGRTLDMRPSGFVIVDSNGNVTMP